MKSLRMKIAAGSSPPVRTSATPLRSSMSPSWNINRKIGTIAAVPVTIDESRSNAYRIMSRPGTRTRERAYAARADSAVTSSIAPPEMRIEFFSDERAYGFLLSSEKLSRVKSGIFTVRVGVLSNGASTSHSSGNAKKTASSVMSA